MDACEKSAVNAREMEEDFYECVNGLIEIAGSYGFAGNLWHNYLTLLLKEIVGQKALAKGYHPMELRYFDQNGGQLKLKVTGSDGKEIPFTHLDAH